MFPVTAIVRQFVRSDASYDTSPTHPALRILSIGTEVIFGIAVPVTVFKFTVGGIASFAALKMTLVVSLSDVLLNFDGYR
jgi:hypothetical protein